MRRRQHPVEMVERAALHVLRQAVRWIELSAPLQAYLSRHDTQVLRDIPYQGSGQRAHLLDVYRPRSASHSARLPTVLYVHGGGFEICSKETHWMMAQQLVQCGFLVCCINYRLAPEHAFPCGLEDVCAAYLWLLDNAERFGGDSSRIIVAGESAGGNLATSLALASCVERPEEWARAVYRRNEPPAGVVAACGLLEVENPHRFHELAERSWKVTKQTIEHIARSYLPHHPRHVGEHDLASPLRLLESTQALTRPLPPFFLACGTSDPLLHDTQRLEAALKRRHVEHEARYYDGEIHAFHAMWWRAQSRLLWDDTRRFMLLHLDARRASSRVEIAA